MNKNIIIFLLICIVAFETGLLLSIKSLPITSKAERRMDRTYSNRFRAFKLGYMKGVVSGMNISINKIKNNSKEPSKELFNISWVQDSITFITLLHE